MTVVKTKKVKSTKKCVIKRKLKFEKKEIDVDTLKKDHKDFLKNYKLILKTQ